MIICRGSFPTNNRIKWTHLASSPKGAERVTMAKKILIHKEAGQRKDAVRVNTITDIPDFLQESISIEGDQVKLVCVEGDETFPIGSVIGYEESQTTSTGWNCWCIGNASTNLIEKDGVFYKKATVLEAQAVDGNFPEFLKGAPITQNPDGSWTIKTSWGEITGSPGKAYWVKYGMTEDGSLDANILTKTEKSYQDYIVCDESGQDIGWLSELDPA